MIPFIFDLIHFRLGQSVNRVVKQGEKLLEVSPVFGTLLLERELDVCKKHQCSRETKCPLGQYNLV